MIKKERGRRDDLMWYFFFENDLGELQCKVTEKIEIRGKFTSSKRLQISIP
jgi:hypothetical protein